MSNTIASAWVRFLFQLVLLPLIVLMLPAAFSFAWVGEALRDWILPVARSAPSSRRGG